MIEEKGFEIVQRGKIRDMAGKGVTLEAEQTELIQSGEGGGGGAGEGAIEAEVFKDEACDSGFSPKVGALNAGPMAVVGGGGEVEEVGWVCFGFEGEERGRIGRR